MAVKARFGAGLAALVATSSAWADKPVQGGIGMQEPATAIAVQGHWFHNVMLMPVLTAVCVLVLGLLIYIAIRFNAKANPVPSKTTHNTFIEVVWTVVPILILIVFAVPSFKLLYAQAKIPPADLVIKATGHQWNWNFEYVDQKFEFVSALMPEQEARAKKLPYLLEVDNRLVVPAGAVVKVQVTGADVIHAFAIPSFFVQMDGVPGRLNETWFKVDKPGIYYGQCGQLCGQNHAYMPIAVEVISKEKFAAWVAEAKVKFASADRALQYAMAAPAAVRP
jgi:cytochrome c oxidase subunit II